MDKQKQITELISLWRASGLTKSAFCNNQQISIHKFNYWLKKFSETKISKSNENEIRFFSVEDSKVKNTSAKANAKPSILVELPNGIKINFFAC